MAESPTPRAKQALASKSAEPKFLCAAPEKSKPPAFTRAFPTPSTDGILGNLRERVKKNLPATWRGPQPPPLYSPCVTAGRIRARPPPFWGRRLSPLARRCRPALQRFPSPAQSVSRLHTSELLVAEPGIAQATTIAWATRSSWSERGA